MPSTLGIVASGEDVLNDAVFWVDAARSSIVSGALSNLGTGGSALNAQFGNTTGVDSFDPALLAHTGTNYLWLPGVAGNSVTCTAPAAATSYAASPLGGGADTTGAATGGAAFTFNTAGSWTSVRLLNASLAVVAEFTVTAGSQTGQTDGYGVTWSLNRTTSGRKAVAVVRPTLLFGTDDYLETADSPLLNFGASDSFTVVAVVRQWATPTSYGRFVDKKNGGGAGLGWSLSSNSTTNAPGEFIGDGVNQQGQAGSTVSSGTQYVAGSVLDRTSQLLRVYTSNTASATVSTSAVGTLSNTLPMRIGCAASAQGSFADMELLAAAVWRRALNANEIATIVARYT